MDEEKVTVMSTCAQRSEKSAVETLVESRLTGIHGSFLDFLHLGKER